MYLNNNLIISNVIKSNSTKNRVALTIVAAATTLPDKCPLLPTTQPQPHSDDFWDEADERGCVCLRGHHDDDSLSQEVEVGLNIRCWEQWVSPSTTPLVRSIAPPLWYRQTEEAIPSPWLQGKYLHIIKGLVTRRSVQWVWEEHCEGLWEAYAQRRFQC